VELYHSLNKYMSRMSRALLMLTFHGYIPSNYPIDDRCHLPIPKSSFNTHKATNLFSGSRRVSGGSNLLTSERGGLEGFRVGFRTEGPVASRKDVCKGFGFIYCYTPESPFNTETCIVNMYNKESETYY